MEELFDTDKKNHFLKTKYAIPMKQVTSIDIGDNQLFIVKFDPQYDNNNKTPIKVNYKLTENNIQINNLNIIGIIIHDGSNSTHGNYFTFVRKTANDWYYCNDDKEINKMNISEVCEYINEKKYYTLALMFYTQKLNNINNNLPKKLNNFGNSCYRNVIYQNLFNFQPFIKFLNDNKSPEK